MQVPDGALNYFHFFEKNKHVHFDRAGYTDIRMKNVKKTTKTVKIVKPAALTIAAVIAELEKLATKYGMDAKLIADKAYFDGRGYAYRNGCVNTVFTRVVRDEKDEIAGIYVDLRA